MSYEPTTRAGRAQARAEKRALRDLRPRASRPTRPDSAECSECGATFTAPPGRTGPIGNACSRSCKATRDLRLRRERRATRRALRACLQCGGSMAGTIKAPKFCSEECLAESRRPAPRVCVECGAEYRPKGDSLFCGPCRSIHFRRSDASTHKRRAAKYGGAFERGITLERIALRDGWTCGICARPIDQLLDYPDEGSPSVDHVVLMSAGGDHSMANVRLAHLGCNITRAQRKDDPDVWTQFLAFAPDPIT